MKTAKVRLKSASPYAQGRHYANEIPKLNKEGADAYEQRTWINRLHTTTEGKVLIPPFAFKNALDDAAKFLGEQIPGKGKSTYTKHFQAGVMVLDPMVLKTHKDEVRKEARFVPADGKPGSGKRVMKYFPVIDSWEGEVEFLVLDDTITLPVLEHHLKQAGQFIGLGVSRPRNRGVYGRFIVEKVEWKDSATV
jgi:hypothetical protein